jgi:N-acylneuraminate cytidylyltransferase
MSAARRLAVIPARGGSRRVPRKNVREFRGRPMIHWSIEAAIASGLFSRVVVSTDDEEIAAIARAAGAEVPFLRAAAISDDVTPVSAATADALERLDPEGREFTEVAQLMANCPLRTAGDVASSAEAFARGAAHSQLSVVRFGWTNPWWAMRRGPGGVLEPLFPDAAVARGQDLPELVCPTGAIWWIRPEILRRERTFHVAGRSGWEIDWCRGVDIDTEEDWELAESLAETAAASVRSVRG